MAQREQKKNQPEKQGCGCGGSEDLQPWSASPSTGRATQCSPGGGRTRSGDDSRLLLHLHRTLQLRGNQPEKSWARKDAGLPVASGRENR